jgi:uncharacterized protein
MMRKVAILVGALLLAGNCAQAQGESPVLPVASSDDGSALLRRWSPAAQAGEAVGQYMLGMMQLYGQGGASKNVLSGLAWLRLAAAQGYSEAEVELGVACLQSRGMARSPSEAKKYFEAAARRGNARAQVLLGSLLDGGDYGVPLDYSAAARWYQEAASQGRPDAQHLLGLMYRDGRGVQQDWSKAVKWFREAAAKDSADAQYDLGAAYANGDGVPRNVVIGLAWLLISAARGHAEARMQGERIADSLTADEVSRASALARMWQPGSSHLGRGNP